MKTQYDIVILGAGPAGSVLAHQLATHGIQVLIFGKAHLPRYKTCGGGLADCFFRQPIGGRI
ncbi:MAG: FAD-dependent monooxygenase [Anaerolineales bacterium]|nr:FAD-dependent monooxygenase [Anaerolineales bacterium]